jgi:hypothetical protein
MGITIVDGGNNNIISTKEFILEQCGSNAKKLIHMMERFYLLDQPITLEHAQGHSYIALRELTMTLLNGQKREAIRQINQMYDKGYSVIDILDMYFTFIKSCSTLSEDQKYEIIQIICKYITIFNTIHEDKIELALFINEMIKVCSSTTN